MVRGKPNGPVTAVMLENLEHQQNVATDSTLHNAGGSMRFMLIFFPENFPNWKKQSMLFKHALRK